MGCGTLLSRQRDQLRGSKHVSDPKVMSLPKVSKGSDPAEVAKAVRRRVVQSLGGDTAVLATAVDPRCAFAVVLRYTSRVARLLHTAVSGDGLYKAVLEPKFDLTLARMASERSLRTFVVWPPVVHLQRDDDDTPTDGYGGNSSRFIEAYRYGRALTWPYWLVGGENRIAAVERASRRRRAGRRASLPPHRPRPSSAAARHFQTAARPSRSRITTSFAPRLK